MNAGNVIYVRTIWNWTALREGNTNVKSGCVCEVSFLLAIHLFTNF
jgi:hypothetical protein